MWGKILDVNQFIDNSFLDSDRAISIHLCDNKLS